MNAVETVKAICKERKIPISKLEKDLGFGNGYISQLKKGTFPDDRLYKIADYLGIDPRLLSSGEAGENKKPATESDGIEKDKLDYFYDMFNKLSPDEQEQFVTNVLKQLLHNQ